MTSIKNKTTAISILMVLILATSAALITIPSVKAKTTFTMAGYATPYTGVNSPTAIFWVPTPNIFNTNPSFPNKTGGQIWSDAVVTFTRPDGSKDIINGPVTLRAYTVGGVAPRIQTIYTPNQQGNWTGNFYWPGDSTYNAVNTTMHFTVGAHFEKRDVWAYLSIKPYPAVGLGQDILVNAWVTPAPAVNYANFQGFVFTFTRPDGTSFTVGPMDSEGPGVVWFNLPLDALGNWTVKMDFPGDWLDLPATTTRTITVQNEWIPGYPEAPLPTEPWNVPININNREWRTIAGPWYMTQYNASVGAWNPYTEAPRTAHIIWILPPYAGTGGYVGSPLGIRSSSGNADYGAEATGIYSASVPTIRTVMDGRGYYTATLGGVGYIVCVDMQTGKQLWAVPGSFNVGAERSRIPVLYYFGNNFTVFNALDGSVTLNTTGLSGMTFFDNPYVYLSASGRLIKWDTTPTTTNFTARIVWNVTDPAATGGGLGRYSFSAIQSGVWVSLDTAGPAPDMALNNGGLAMIGVNTTTGAIMYNDKSVFDLSNSDTWLYRQGPMGGSGFGLFYTATVPHENAGKGWEAWYAATGQKAWVSEETDSPWGNFWSYMPEASCNGMVIATGYSGVYAFNATNGKIVWHYIDTDTYYEEPYASDEMANGTAYASYSFGSTGPVAGGDVIYAPNSEHSPTFYYRGMGMSAIDASTGQKLWKILGAWTPTAVAYGTLLATDTPNGFAYAFAKGETATTVSSSAKVFAKGASTLLEGTVLDMSPAQTGTAAISDADQTDWMQYLHMQQPFPTNAKGVTVSLDAMDPNNNFVHIGNATSDTTGKYSFLWTPEIEGKYTVVASFYNTEAYYGSSAETSIGVTTAPATSTPQTEQIQPADNTPILYAIVGIGIALLIALAVATLLIIRKRQ